MFTCVHCPLFSATLWGRYCAYVPFIDESEAQNSAPGLTWVSIGVRIGTQVRSRGENAESILNPCFNDPEMQAESDRPALLGSVLGASCRWMTSVFKVPARLPHLLSHLLPGVQLSQETVFSLGYYKWETWCLPCSCFSFPLFTIIRMSCFSFRIRRLLFCWPKTSRKQTEPPLHVNFTGTGLWDGLTSLHLTPVSSIYTFSDEGGQSQ